MSVKDMPCVTVEQVLELRKRAIELEAENKKLKLNQIPESHFVLHEDDLYALYKFASEHDFKGVSFDGCMKIANQCCDGIMRNLNNIADRIGHPRFDEWKMGAADDSQY